MIEARELAHITTIWLSLRCKDLFRYQCCNIPEFVLLYYDFVLLQIIRSAKVLHLINLFLLKWFYIHFYQPIPHNNYIGYGPGTVKTVDIVCISETHFISTEPFRISGYKIYRNDRITQHTSGELL